MALIETNRLILRELVDTDVQGIYELDSDPEVHEYLGNHPISSLKEAADVISFIKKQYIENGIGRLAIIEKETGTFVGWGGFKLITTVVNRHQHYPDLGYRFIKQHWGKGYATESSLAAIEYGFEQLKLPAIYATAHVENIRSIKVLEKAGLKCVETFEYENETHLWFKLENPYH